MSARSSRLTSVACLVLAACGSKHQEKPKPTADPAKVAARAKETMNNVPTIAAVPDCKPTDLVGATMTYRTVELLAGATLPTDPEHADWINPPELDSPAARVLLPGGAGSGDDAKQRAGEAAAELLGQPWIVYHVDMVNAPIALAIKELKIGTVGTRVLRFDQSGHVTCSKLFVFQNDKAKSDWAIANSDKTVIPPEIAKAMRDDLADRFVKLVPRAPAPPAPAP